MAKMTLVIADDDPDAAEILSMLLQFRLGEPLDITLAFDGAQAVTAGTGALAPHAVILDLEMPRKNGMEVAHEIRQAHGRYPTLIIVSGHKGWVEVAQQSSEIDHALYKPVDVDKLVSILQEVRPVLMD